MYSLIIAGVCGVTTGLTLYFTDTFGYGWSIFFGILGFGVVQMSIGLYLQRKVKAGMKADPALADASARLDPGRAE